MIEFLFQKFSDFKIFFNKRGIVLVCIPSGIPSPDNA